jgi:hypothetical protein
MRLSAGQDSISVTGGEGSIFENLKPSWAMFAPLSAEHEILSSYWITEAKVDILEP